jgi:hypothetical protein
MPMVVRVVVEEVLAQAQTYRERLELPIQVVGVEVEVVA